MDQTTPTQVSLRLDGETVGRLDHLAERLSDELRTLTRSDVLRYVLTRGITIVEEERAGASDAS